MEYRALGRTGHRVSAIGFGAWGIGGGLWTGSDDDASLAALAAALEAGCTFFDTALAYGDGHSERLIARALEDAPATVVATKVPPQNRRWPAARGVALRDVFPPEHVRDCAERSAANLARPIDLLQFHVWMDEWLEDPLWRDVERTLEILISHGTVRAVGISANDHDPDGVLEALRRCELVGAVQVIYNVFDRSPERRLLPLCIERGIGVIARVPLDEGGLTGSIGADTKFPDGDFRNVYFAGGRRAELARRMERLEPVLLRESGSLVEGALRFCLSHPAVSTVIPGMRTAEHARANCATADGRALSPRLLGELEDHAWERNWYPGNGRTGLRAGPFVLPLLLLLLWEVLAFFVPVGSGWVHLLLAAGGALLVRAVVTATPR